MNIHSYVIQNHRTITVRLIDRIYIKIAFHERKNTLPTHYVLSKEAHLLSMFPSRDVDKGCSNNIGYQAYHADKENCKCTQLMLKHLYAKSILGNLHPEDNDCLT